MARPAIKLIKAFAKSLDEKTRVQFYLDILAGDVDFSKYSPDQPREVNGQWGDGGGSSTTTDYRMQHQAPTRGDGSYGSPATNVEEVMPDFYKHPEYYTTGMDKADKESIAALMSIKDNPDAKVTIYRAVPGNVSQINQGDWITLSHSYAVGHTGYLENENGHVISQTVSAKDLWFDGNSVNEFGYDPVVAKALFAKYLAKSLDPVVAKVLAYQDPTLSDTVAEILGFSKTYDPAQERDDHGRWSTDGGARSGTSPSALAEKLHNKAVALEPKLTATMKDLAAKNGVELSGLSKAVKGADSLERKIGDDAKKDYSGDNSKAAAKISDANRYTMVTDPEHYTEAGKAVQTQLEEQGYNVRTKNFWQEGSNYKGVNMALTDQQGNQIELQFHTPESLNVKAVDNHPIYEEYRKLDEAGQASPHGRDLNQQMVDNVANLVHPANVASWGTPKIGKSLSWSDIHATIRP